MLTGCAGISTSIGSKRTEARVSDQSGYKLKSGGTLNWATTPHPANGIALAESERQWCGFAVWLIIPFPMMLPVCSAYTEVRFVDDIPTTSISYEPQTFFALCGPGIAMMAAGGHAKKSHFCESGTL